MKRILKEATQFRGGALIAQCFVAVWVVMVGGPVWAGTPVPAPKILDLSGEMLNLGSSVTISIFGDGNFDISGYPTKPFQQVFRKHGIDPYISGVEVGVGLGEIEEVSTSSKYAAQIKSQAYRIEILYYGIEITGASEQALFYAAQTLDQLIEDKKVPQGTIVDWPDLPMRMIMVDPARQNENQDYYKRVIKFARRYKINYILCHLTDDQTSALYHEDYPEIMHEYAWTPENVYELVSLARDNHIKLIPEIESLGHSRLFTRMPDYADYLHQTAENDPDESWMGTDIPGFTNVLCPASPKALEYLDTMYGWPSREFLHDWIHIGFDEVDMTYCERCIEKFGEQTESQWMTTALHQANSLVKEHGKKTALWGDMLLSHPEVIEALEPEDYIIFDWYYREDVNDKSVKKFLDHGFEVIASPALACSPHMVIPDVHNYENISKFSKIARENDILGVNTTIWVPTRYMSDVMWTGIAYAGAHAWGGSNFDEADFFTGFMKDYFGSDRGAEYHNIWQEAAGIIWHRREFNTGCWIDEASLADARSLAALKRDEISYNISKLSALRKWMKEVRPSITKNQNDWETVEYALAIQQFSMEHLLAAPYIPHTGLLEELNAEGDRLLSYIEKEWDENRFADDPGKEGRFLQIQHLLFRFKQMQDFHSELLNNE